MRTIAKIQFTSPVIGILSNIDEIIKKWSDRKFSKTESGQTQIRHSGLDALFERAEQKIPQSTLIQYSMIEPIKAGSFETDFKVLESKDRTFVQTTLSVDYDAGILTPDISVHAPRFVRDILSTNHAWTIGVGGERLFAQSLSAESHDIDQFVTLLESSMRRLPIAVVSELDGEVLAGDLHERLSQDLAGLAHIIRLTSDGAWELTNRLGREWSCYNGAVRLFWPMRFGMGDFKSHPLWTLDWITSRAPSDVAARDKLRRDIARRIFEASTFVPDDPAIRNFEVAKTRLASDQARAAAADSHDLQEIADLYAAENDVLRARVDEQDNQIRILSENVESLSLALRTAQVPVADKDADIVPQTISEAVIAARGELKDRIVIATETDSDIAEVNPEAGPPEKILRYLRVLADLGDVLKLGSLGKSVPIWLREHGVECSGDSDTEKNSVAGKRQRTRMVNGSPVDCEFHAKPTDATSPDRCIRIYFGIVDDEPHVRIGYIGRHF